ncbi:MAG: hypothetical protein GY859_08735 [Desulfobacterales bacterium]|nr:hypothetical protein [Desulfobacterales bacterium]
MIDLDKGVGDRPLVVKWDITHQAMLSFEIDTDAVEAVLPEGLVARELRPGASLLQISMLRYAPGNFGPDSPVFLEVVVILSIAPDLSWDMPTPRFSFYPLTVYSDSKEFVDSEADRVGTPTVLVESLEVHFRNGCLQVEASDKHGPIAWLRNTHPEPKFKHKGFWGQQINDTKGPLNGSPWHWEGEIFEHQRRGEWGKLHPHPIFKDLDISSVRTCYRQMFAKAAGSHCYERFYQVRPVEI